jgi:hypothetical protein
MCPSARKAFVIECKEWGIRPPYSHSNILSELERDLKGVVDGYKYSTISGVSRIKRIISLLEKIGFVRNNLRKWNLERPVVVERVRISSKSNAIFLFCFLSYPIFPFMFTRFTFFITILVYIYLFTTTFRTAFFSTQLTSLQTDFYVLGLF